MKDLPDIRITDPYVRQLVANEQRVTGEKTAAKVAARLIIERVAQQESRRAIACREQPETTAAA